MFKLTVITAKGVKLVIEDARKGMLVGLAETYSDCREYKIEDTLTGEVVVEVEAA